MRNTMTNREGGTDREEFRVEQVIDRASTVGTVWLGLTVGCARCHDHKFDPITQKEFYQLFAFFNSDDEVNIEAPLPGEMGPYLARYPEYQKKRQELIAQYPVARCSPNGSATRWRPLRIRRRTCCDPLLEASGLAGRGLQDVLRLPPERRSRRQADELTDHFLESYGNIVSKDAPRS